MTTKAKTNSVNPLEDRSSLAFRANFDMQGFRLRYSKAKSEGKTSIMSLIEKQANTFHELAVAAGITILSQKEWLAYLEGTKRPVAPWLE